MNVSMTTHLVHNGKKLSDQSTSLDYSETSTQNKIMENKKHQSAGQVSIFLVFLFQVLFVFFAMVINVGLLVYYKINLQNSVDLAAYYGAMKQAEMLNTIGHINYQIRQSWKLLAYRSMILGTLGPDIHPARPITLGSDNFKPPPGEIIFSNESGEALLPVFCITIADVYVNVIGIGDDTTEKKINLDDNQCRKFKGLPLSGFKIPDLIFALPSANAKIRDGAIALQDKFLGEFSGGGVRNYLTLAYFITLFRADSMNRRKVMAVLANALSGNTNNFPDIEGNGVYEGAKKVLQKNLAEQNNTSLSSELYNSLGNQGCGGSNPDGESFPAWLKEVDVLTYFPYMDSIINDEVLDGPEKAMQALQVIGLDPKESLPSTLKPELSSYPGFLIINSFITAAGRPKDTAGRWTTTVGVEKNPWCMPYIGFKATSSPKLPFMPARFSPKLQAKAFAKPFGSQIGPWYGKTWPGRTLGSTSDTNDANRIDMRLPPRLLEGMTNNPSLGPNDRIRFLPNYSRFPGDRLGLLSQGARWAYGRFYWKKRTLHPPFWTSMWKEPTFEGIDKNSDYSSSFYAGPLSGDILADPFQNKFFTLATDINQAKQFAREMRISELAAIAPDLFDITYYPIEPRFNQHILPNLQKLIKNINTKRPKLLVRGDLGWRSPDFPGDALIASPTVNIENQIESFKFHDFFKITGQQIFQTVTEPTVLLTSWAESSIIDYDNSLSASKIANCSVRVPANAEPWTSGACVKGGRTGFSVKLVSKKFLSNDIPNLGGEGVGGTILNPPDTSF